MTMLHHEITRALIAERLADAEDVRRHRYQPKRRLRLRVRMVLSRGMAAISRRWSSSGPPAHTPEPLDLTIRFAYQEDAAALERLRELDSRSLPGGPLLVAEVNGAIRAAVDLGGAGVVADPFVPTADLVSLLRHRVFQLRGVPIAPALADRLVGPEFPDPSWFGRGQPTR
jgi:hypothetical protein